MIKIMLRLKTQQLIWFLSFLIIAQTIWIDFRLDKLIKNSPENLLIQQQKQIEENLKRIPEPEIKQQLVKGAELWLEPREASFSSDFKLEIWVKSERPIKKVDLRLFYPPEILQVIDSNWQVDEKIGLASWSGEFIPERLEKTDPGAGWRVQTISFYSLRPGKAKIEFDFSKESLLDCNLIDNQGKDILEEVEGGEYIINF